MDAVLHIVPSGDGTVTVGGTAMLVDAAGRLLYSLEMTINQETHEVMYRQATEDNYVAVRTLDENDRVSEAYEADGDGAVFTYAQLSEQARTHVINQIEHGMPDTNLPENAREYAAQPDGRTHPAGGGVRTEGQELGQGKPQAGEQPLEFALLVGPEDRSGSDHVVLVMGNAGRESSCQ
jgi:hypothetical protein